MKQDMQDESIGAEVTALRGDIPGWVVAVAELVERAQNAERAAARINPEVADRSRKLIVEIAEWQKRLTGWQRRPITPRLGAELRILKATLDASMDEANSAAGALHLFD
jgi:hypothetical protein